MKRSDPWELTANRVTGLIAMGLIAGLVVWMVVGWIFSGPVVEPRVFVAYFENTAGLREGDAVRIQGRRAGYVTNVTVVQHEGRAMARVEFAIAPGTGSPWLQEMVDTGGLPADSSISVRPPGMRGRPQLDIKIGEHSDKLIKVGEQWKNTKSASQEDTFSQWQEDLDRARAQFDDISAFFEDEQWDAFNWQLADLRDTLENADADADSIVGKSAGLIEGLHEATRKMDEMSANLNARPPDSEGLVEFADNLRQASAEIDDLERQLDEAADEIVRMRENSEAALTASESESLQKSVRDLRGMAARLRASMERAVGDPSRAGNLPPTRFWRPYYHGGEPRRGTSISDPPVTPPGDGIGIPKGTDRPPGVK
ncbi:MAG: MlaD family protein [Planctomycetes bacterium]|nr:MlaD family protein [Planctomycetota bacterium]